MACLHKFFGHPAHMAGQDALLPNWNADTLIIGTFNPSNEWVQSKNNNANYFYGRSRNYFWDVLPRFANLNSIPKQDTSNQFSFLKNKRIALTDLLISINDADINNPNHLNRISSFKDDDLNVFKKLNWNTGQIKQFIKARDISAVFFTKLGGSGIFEQPIREIERFCVDEKIISHRLFTPSGQKIGHGKPRSNRLIHKWFIENGGNQFPFLYADFNITSVNFRYQ